MAKRALNTSVIWSDICRIARIRNPMMARKPNLPLRELLLVYATLNATQAELATLQDQLADEQRRRLALEMQLQRLMKKKA